MGSLDPDRIRELLANAKANPSDPDALLELQEMLGRRYQRIIRRELRRRVPEYNDASGDVVDIWDVCFWNWWRVWEPKPGGRPVR
jgi:hypothetical protein